MARDLRNEGTRVLDSLRQALATLRPILIIAALTQAVHLSVIAPDGFFAQIYHLQWPRWSAALLANLTTVLWGSLALMIAGLMVTTLSHRYHALGVIAALAFMVLLTTDPTRPLEWPHLGPSALLLAVGLAPLLAWLFDQAKAEDQAAWCLTGVILLGLVLGASCRWAGNHVSWAWLTLPTPLLIPINLLLVWLGLPRLLAPLTDFAMSPAAAANLNFALLHPHAATVPYQYTAYTLFEPFGNMGGSGTLLALVIALALVNRRLPLPALLTSAVNLPLLTLLTTPVVLNVQLLAPFLLAPLASSGLAALALWLHLMPPVVYPVPPTTPGPLIAFLGTNGSWAALAISALCLLVSVAIYYPFVNRLAKGVTPHA
ncbi:hypothetical protein ACFQ3L_04250 [Lacticaseibacillus jixianensis]|uniref:PTS sugar transporter subunit IIC n=1 Tax=Lacticaseibacillus jixianensis TaxID=2486012 RepID=A0ABW4B7V7_9LACO|nr:hypothetical protein [Lacticaseibacillus jixianensis]